MTARRGGHCQNKSEHEFKPNSPVVQPVVSVVRSVAPRPLSSASPSLTSAGSAGDTRSGSPRGTSLSHQRERGNQTGERGNQIGRVKTLSRLRERFAIA